MVAGSSWRSGTTLASSSRSSRPLAAHQAPVPGPGASALRRRLLRRRHGRAGQGRERQRQAVRHPRIPDRLPPPAVLRGHRPELRRGDPDRAPAQRRRPAVPHRARAVPLPLVPRQPPAPRPAGDTVFSLAGRYFAPLPRPAGLWSRRSPASRSSPSRATPPRSS